MSPPSNNPGPLDSRWFGICASHLAKEEQLLASILTVLRQARSALLRADWAQLTELVASQERLAADDRSMASAREALQRELAPLLGLPAEEVTFERVSRALPDTYALGPMRERLKGMVQEAETLRQGNTTMLRYCLDFYRQFLGELGGQNVPERYGRGGKRPSLVSGSLIQGRG